MFNDIFDVTQCNISQIIGESNRFLFHIFLVHISTCIIEGNKSLFGEDFFRTLLITALAILLYHIFFRKIMEPIIEKMKLICYDKQDRNEKIKDLTDDWNRENIESDDLDFEYDIKKYKGIRNYEQFKNTNIKQKNAKYNIKKNRKR